VLPKTCLIIVYLLQAYSVFESSLKNKTTKSQALHDNFYKEKAFSLQPLQGTSCSIII
jgi:hypothetical protein